MSVIATCTDCQSTHEVAVRVYNGTTTECPTCDSPSYTTECVSDTKDVESDEIRSQLLEVPNVGETIVDNLEATVGSLTLLDTLSAKQLKSVDGIGSQTAVNIKNNL